MLRKQIKWGWLACAAVLVSCHSGKNKSAANAIQHKDTAAIVVKKESEKKPPESFLILDTIVKNDTLKVLWYQNGSIKCLLNGFSDSIEDADISWDIRDSLSQLADGFNRIITPYNHKPLKFLLNNKVLLFTLVDWKGRANLFLLNRTKTALKFAQQNDDNPICRESGYVYVDLKHNNILEHGRQDRREHDKQADALDDTSSNVPYWIYQYKITDKHFVQTDLDTAFFKEFLKIDVDEAKGARIFYTIIAQRQNWKHCRNNPNAYQKVVVIDTIVDKDTIKISYDNKGNVTGTLNGNSRSGSWLPWKGYEWWRGKTDAIIVPGENRPRSFIWNDTLIMVALMNKDQYPVLFLFKKTGTSLNLFLKVAGGGCKYIYVDLKKNIIINNDGQDYQDYEDRFKPKPVASFPENLPYWINRYRIIGDSLQGPDNDTSFFKEFLDIGNVDSYNGSKAFYNIILQRENWERDKYVPHSH